MLKTTRPNLYDYLKIIAIALMIIDHLGFFFFPDALWMRLLGRGAFPIFLTLVGLSGSYKRRRDLVLGAIITQVPIAIFAISNHAYGFLTLNILWSIVIARSIAQLIEKKDIKRYVVISVMLFPMMSISEVLFDYGIFAIYFVLRGSMIRQQKSILITSIYGESLRALLLIFSIKNFHFPLLQQAILCVYAIIHIVLMYVVEYKNHSIYINKKRDKIIYRTAKNALPIYVIHLSIFVVIKAILGHILR